MFNSITGQRGWQCPVGNPVRAFQGLRAFDSVDDGDGDWSGIEVKCWELNKSGDKGKGQHGPGMPVSSLAFFSASFPAPQDSPLFRNSRGLSFSSCTSSHRASLHSSKVGKIVGQQGAPLQFLVLGNPRTHVQRNLGIVRRLRYSMSFPTHVPGEAFPLMP